MVNKSTKTEHEGKGCGREIAFRRREAGIRQEQLGREMGLNMGTIIDIERERILLLTPSPQAFLEAVDRLAAQRTPSAPTEG